MRQSARLGVTRLSEFGASAARTFLSLIDDSERFDSNFSEAWRAPLTAGIVGLCQIGSDANAMIGPLLERVDSGVIGRSGHTRDLAIYALIMMGAEPATLWPRFKPSNPDYVDQARGFFDMQVQRSKGDPECYF